MAAVLEKMIGTKFTRLTVIGVESVKVIKSGVRLQCECECGKTCLVSRQNLLSGRQKSCGCLKIERTIAAHRIHGASSDLASQELRRTYGVWNKMIDRCRGKRAKCFKTYGSKGIVVCERWHKFQNFIDDMGERPSPRHQIDRVDNSKGYSPDNCRWVLPKQQQRNRTNNLIIDYQDQSKSLAEWCEQLGLSYIMVYLRITRRKWPVERALTTQPLRSKESQSRKRRS